MHTVNSYRITDRNFLCFKWQGQVYQFICLPNGPSCAPRKFTKILKPALANLHSLGHISSPHIDDCYLQGQIYDKRVNVFDTFMLFDWLGIVIHPDKSILIHSQEIVTLGFLITSITMTIRLTKEKALDIFAKASTYKRDSKNHREHCGKFSWGNVQVSVLPGIRKRKDPYLGNTKRHLTIEWWECNVEHSFNCLPHNQPQHQMQWVHLPCFRFPPFNVIGNMLAKID